MADKSDFRICVQMLLYTMLPQKSPVVLQRKFRAKDLLHLSATGLKDCVDTILFTKSIIQQLAKEHDLPAEDPHRQLFRDAHARFEDIESYARCPEVDEGWRREGGRSDISTE